VVGAGIVGCAAAYALGQDGHKVLLIGTLGSCRKRLEGTRSHRWRIIAAWWPTRFV
jgi:glycine/D-amino acid oxidase-like deaminating enzyme